MAGAQGSQAKRPRLNERQAVAICHRFRIGGPDDLPAANPRISLMEGKAQIVAALVCGMIDENAVCERYLLTPLELRVWRRLVEDSSFYPA